jgi:hypothetical protein
VNTIVKVAALVIAGVAGGIWSAHRGIERAGAVYAGSPWKTWTRDTNHRSPYADAHFILAGQLPMPASQFIIYQANTDGGGSELDGDCTYAVTGRMPAARWWSFSTGERQGYNRNTDRGPPQQVTSVNAIAEASGEVRVTVSAGPAAGNWVSPGNGSKFTLMLVLHDPARRGRPFPGPDELPTIERTVCS